jgi:hypothetical protein
MTPLAIDKVLSDQRLLGAELAPIETWSPWQAVLKAAFALPLTDDERTIFTSVAGGRVPPLKRVRELWCIIGRRGGKSRIAAALACYFSVFAKHKLAGGERGMVLVLAATVEQAKVVFAYTLAFLNSSPVLQKEIASATQSEIRLKNGITIGIHPNSFRSVRGRTLCACIFDEVSFWRDDTTATPDTETYTAVLPSLITTGGMLVGISSPYRRVGLMHAKHKKYFGVASDDTLVVQGPTLVFNRTLDPEAIAAQREADPTASRSEWDAEFRADLAGFLDDELIDAAIDHDRPLELPPRPGIFYQAFCDASGVRRPPSAHRRRRQRRHRLDAHRAQCPYVAFRRSSPMTKKRWEIFETATGKPVEDDGDPNGVLQPGHTLRVLVRDSKQREVHAHAEYMRFTDAAAGKFGPDVAASMHRPGPRFATDRAHVDAVYFDEKQKLMDAWREPVADVRGQKPGDQCTIDGQPGHLDHRLQCVPDKRQDSAPRTMDAAEGQRIKDEAWLASVKELEEAWRR